MNTYYPAAYNSLRYPCASLWPLLKYERHWHIVELQKKSKSVEKEKRKMLSKENIKNEQKNHKPAASVENIYSGCAWKCVFFRVF